MSKIPDDVKSKYNKNDPYSWVDSQWEKFITEQREHKAKILELEMENAELKDVIEELGGNDKISGLNKTNVESIRSDEWRINQFNRNRAMEDQVKTIEEMEEKVKELFSEPKYVYERNPDTGQMYRKEVGKPHSERIEVDSKLNPLPEQLELF